MKNNRAIRLPLLASALSFLLSIGLLTGCAPGETSATDPSNTFEWYAEGCVKAAEAAQGLYSGADSPIGRQVAETALDALVGAAKEVSNSLPQDSTVTPRLESVLDMLESRTPLTDISEQDKERFEQNKAVVLDAIGEVGQMCRSVFAGFEVTETPQPRGLDQPGALKDGS